MRTSAANITDDTGRRKTIYLSGPMTGHAGYNYPAFHAAAADLRLRGFAVINPAENEGGRIDLPRAAYMRLDIESVLRADLVVVLSGWRGSRGARLEVEIAREIGIPILAYPHLDEPQHASILDEATVITAGSRRSAYGHPLDDYTRTAKLWSTILDADVTAQQAMLCMIAVKISRECHSHGRDNLVDIAGYAHCLQWAHEEAERCRDAVMEQA